jgi:hypothetical protein
MPWRFPFSQRKRAEDAVCEIVTSDALHNRAALNPRTLKLYREIFSDPHDAGLIGERFAELISAFARERDMPMPVDFPAILAFMNEELRDFDTPEATEIRERAELAELKRLLSGLRPEPDVDRIRRSKAAKALLLTPAEEHLLSVYECECEELKAKSRQLVARPQKEAALSTELRRSIRYFFAPY